MAACTTSYFEAGYGLSARNAEFMARQPQLRRGTRTPEFFFPKHFDNSRIVKAPDPAQARQMHRFSFSIVVFLSLTMLYGFQHFSAIEGGYRVESQKQLLDQLSEENRQLRLVEAQLTEPTRIDRLAREQGLAAPEPGQIVQPGSRPDVSAPILAQAVPPAPAAQ